MNAKQLHECAMKVIAGMNFCYATNEKHKKHDCYKIDLRNNKLFLEISLLQATKYYYLYG